MWACRCPALTVQSDGKVVLAGTANLGATATQTDFAMARYSSEGTIDDSFGVAGKVSTDIGGSSDFVEALAVQPGDGKLILAGHTSKNADASFVIARYGKDGNLDAGFARGGTLVEDFGGSNDYAYAVTPQSDGKILVAGYTQSKDFAGWAATATGDDFAMVRINP